MSTLPGLLQGGRARGRAWWLVPTLLLGLLVGWEIDWGRQFVRLPPAPAPLEPKPVALALLPDYAIEGGLPANSETVNRTLFNATRRPAPVPAGEGGPRTLKPGQFLLVGTTMSGARNIAFLKEVAGGKSHMVYQGETINGMLVASVTADQVKLTLGDEAEELVLKVARGPKTTLAAAPPPPVAAAPAALFAPAPTAAAPVANPMRAAGVPGQGLGQSAREARRAKAALVAGGKQAAGSMTPQGTGK